MDLGEGSTWSIILADKTDKIFCFWHAHRIAITGVCLFLVFLLRLLRRGPGPRPLQSGDPSPASEARNVWLEDPGRASTTVKSVGDDKISERVSIPSANQFTKSAAKKVVQGQKPVKEALSATGDSHRFRIQPHIFYASLTGTTSRLAEKVSDLLIVETSDGLDGSLLPPQAHDVSYVDLDDYFISGPKPPNPPNGVRSRAISSFYILLLPSYDIDTILMNFLQHLEETHHDFRIDTSPLSSLTGYAVFGIGDKEGWPTEAEGFCAQAAQADRWMAKLTGGKRAYPLGMADVNSNAEQVLTDWTKGLFATLKDLSKTGGLGEGVPGSGDAVESEDEDSDAEDFPDSKRRKRPKRDKAIDLEDVGGVRPASKPPLAVDFTTYSQSTPQAPKEMVPLTSPTHVALTKQGYSIIGSHSGVKICRWTKSALRGRGSCYKFSFYGIKSHLCMETTPSLSCSNKCVFCWRHGTNPVSTTWRWVVDEPETILEGAKREHYRKIKMMRGVPGVRAERFEEAMRIKHCALSLVGEPVFYPRINEFVDLLHGERISTFLVCNAQHPDELARLKRVTQLYVSIDAGRKESLKKIDRPLHRDFWERLERCLEIVRQRRSWQRTVYRLTLVKNFNVEGGEVEGYADLVEKGLPGFVEIKGVTYCGTSTSKGAGLTMANVPFYEEVVGFVEELRAALTRRGLAYGIAAEHAHSCCVLLADSRRFLRHGEWCTVIDYERYFELLGRHGESHEWGPEDYCLSTPEWAVFGRGGFDPADERVDRKGRPREKAVELF